MHRLCSSCTKNRSNGNGILILNSKTTFSRSNDLQQHIDCIVVNPEVVFSPDPTNHYNPI